MGLMDKLALLAEEAQHKVAEANSGKTFRNVIGFFSPKGGVGTSTVVASTAHILAANDYSVGVVDFDLHYPVQQRFFVKPSKIKTLESVSEKFLNSSLEVANLLNDTIDKKIKLVTALPWDTVPAYFDLSEVSIKGILGEMRNLFDFVLVDLGGIDMAYETVTIGASCCDTLIGVITPSPDVIEAIYKEIRFLDEYGYYTAGTVNIVQNMVMDRPMSNSKLKTLKLDTLAVIPFMPEVALYRYTNKLLINTSVEGKLAAHYKGAMQEIAEFVCNSGKLSSYKIDTEANDEPEAEVEIPMEVEPEVVVKDLGESDIDLDKVDWSVFGGGEDE